MEPEKDIFEQWKEKRDAEPFYQKWWNSISLWWMFDGQYILRNIKQGVKNIIYWFPIVWKDRNWDDSYIFDILKHKLKAQAKYIGSRGIHVNAKRDAEWMMTFVGLMDKIESAFYQMEYMDFHKTKHWFEPTENEGYSTWESRELEENFDEYFAKYPLIYKRVLNGEGPFTPEDENDKHRIAMNIAQLNHKRARKLLFKIMEHNIESWWD